MPSYAPESAAREDERKPDHENDESAAERECEHGVVIRYIQDALDRFLTTGNAKPKTELLATIITAIGDSTCRQVTQTLRFRYD